MNVTEQTIKQIDRALRKTADKYPSTEEASVMTDIHIRVTQESGELVTYDDEDNELTRCVVEQWIGNKDADFYDMVTTVVTDRIVKQKELLESLSILKPYSFVLEDDDCELTNELYVVDDDIAIIDPLTMDSLDNDLDEFLENLLKS